MLIWNIFFVLKTLLMMIFYAKIIEFLRLGGIMKMMMMFSMIITLEMNLIRFALLISFDLIELLSYYISA